MADATDIEDVAEETAQIEEPVEQHYDEAVEDVPLYDDQGRALYMNEQGEACDVQGNPIPEAWEAQIGTPEPEAVVAPEQRQERQWRSPFADGVLNEQEQSELDGLVDERTQYLLDLRAERIAHRIMAARDQQRLAARDLGLAPEAQDEVAMRMSRMEQWVPKEMRGTKNGAMMAAMLAAAEDAIETGDFQGALRKLVTPAPVPNTAPQAMVQPRAPMAPSARTTNPRPTPDVSRPVRRSEQSIGGLSAAELAIIRAERNSVKNGR